MKKNLLLCITFTLIFLHMEHTKGQTPEQMKQQYRLSQETIGWFEGYAENLGGNDFTYESVREDVTASLLTRTTNGEMAIEWVTQAIPPTWNGEYAGFLWIAAMDKPNTGRKFHMYINGEHRFTFTNPSDHWEVQGRDGGVLGFSVFMTDRHGDGHGYMTLRVPAGWLIPGEGLRIKITGEAAGSNTWCIVYKATDALSYLHRAATHETWYDLTGISSGRNHAFNLRAPGHLTGRSLTWVAGDKKGVLHLVPVEDLSGATFELRGSRSDLRRVPFTLFLDERELFNIPGLFIPDAETDIRGNTLVIKEASESGSGSWMLSVRTIYNPGLIERLTGLSNSGLSHGRILLMNSSHQDIAWMDSPERCIIERDTMLLSPLFDQAAKDPGYRFDIEDVLMVREFIERHPERKEEFRELLHSGRLTCGSTYIMPYEEMYSGESLVRQFYLGAKWIAREFEGYKPDTYWNVDVPGRTLQMPQIARKAGTNYMVISRHDMGVFNWYSPDGSFVTTYSPGHYSLSFPYLHRDFFSAASHIAGNALWWEGYNDNPGAAQVMPLLSDWDMSPARDYTAIIQRWHSLKHIVDEQGKQTEIRLPSIELATAREFIRSITAASSGLPSIHGERPAVWVYIHGPSHQKALKASREGDILMTVAEKFSTINAMLSGSFRNYPQERLTEAWEAKIYPDHGWGGKHGDITDALFQQKFEYARDEAARITEHALFSISSRIDLRADRGIPVIVFNSLSWKRNDPVSFRINTEEGWGKNLVVKDYHGREVNTQLTDAQRYADGSIRSAVVNFVAVDVPPVGYKTYYLSTAPATDLFTPAPAPVSFENDFYRISFGRGAIEQIFDKALKREILDNASLLKGGEVFTMRSAGNGAGEFADIQQPTLERFDKVTNHDARWVMVESGPVFSAFTMRQQIRNAVVELKVILYKHIKRIDFETALLNWEGVLYREYRFALPLNMEEGKVAYEVPFGVVEVGKDELEGAAGERYTVPCKDVHPRGIENWISAWDEEAGVTLSSSVAVADYIDPTMTGNTKPLLQPILLASRRSCHGEGNEYLQTGNHHFSFTFVSHAPDWRNGYRSGRQANEKLMVVTDPLPGREAYLPEEQSFFSLESENLIISTIKKCEDDNNFIIRVFDIEGREVSTTLQSFFALKEAGKTNIIEEGMGKIPCSENSLSIEVGKFAIETYKAIPDFQR